MKSYDGKEYNNNVDFNVVNSTVEFNFNSLTSKAMQE